MYEILLHVYDNVLDIQTFYDTNKIKKSIITLDFYIAVYIHGKTYNSYNENTNRAVITNIKRTGYATGFEVL